MIYISYSIMRALHYSIIIIITIPRINEFGECNSRWTIEDDEYVFCNLYDNIQDYSLLYFASMDVEYNCIF